MRRLMWWGIFVLGACGPATKGPPPVDLMSTPTLPSIEAAAYAARVGPPQDAVVARVMAGRVWDPTLSGAAAGLALRAFSDNGGISQWEVREVAWIAGYPYPIRQIRAWSVAQGGLPPTDLGTWLSQARPEDHVGLIRARSAKGDGWVGMMSTPRVDLGVIPRTLEPGQPIQLPVIAGGKAAISDGNGALVTADLDAGFKIVPVVPGEWLVRIDDGKELLALFPVYVGVDPPKKPLMSRASSPPVDAQAIAQRAGELLDLVREAYGVPAWHDDVVLETMAFKVLEGKASAESLSGAGLATVARWDCDEPSVEACVDRWVWDPARRQALLNPKAGFRGIAARIGPAGLQIVVLLGT